MFIHVATGPVSVLGFHKYKHHLGTKFVGSECGLPNTNRFPCYAQCRRTTWKAMVKPVALPRKKTKLVFQSPASQPGD